MVETISNPYIKNWHAFGHIVLIALSLYAIRFTWSFFNHIIPVLSARRARCTKSQLRTLLTTTLTGVRGAVTLAGILTLPVFLRDGDPFPMRSLFIFISAGVILLSLVLATL
ncbi:MAG: hypothetical protein QM793_13815 [Muricomes sp.]